MLVTLMFSVVAVKSRTSQFSYSADEQVCRSWEGAHPASQPRWPTEIFQTVDVMLSLGTGVGPGSGICCSLFREFESPLVWQFELF